MYAEGRCMYRIGMKRYTQQQQVVAVQQQQEVQRRGEALLLYRIVGETTLIYIDHLRKSKLEVS
jgi:hypothetical protein